MRNDESVFIRADRAASMQTDDGDRRAEPAGVQTLRLMWQPSEKTLKVCRKPSRYPHRAQPRGRRAQLDGPHLAARNPRRAPGGARDGTAQGLAAHADRGRSHADDGPRPGGHGRYRNGAGITSRPVQQESAQDETRERRRRKSEMVAPAPDVKPKPVTKPESKPVEVVDAQKPSTGAEVRSGAAGVETREPSPRSPSAVSPSVPLGAARAGRASTSPTSAVPNTSKR